MPVSAVTLRKLMDAGLSGEALIDVVASIDADNAPAPRSSGAERQARYRDRRRNERDVTSDVTSDVTQKTPDKEAPQTPQEINPKNSPPSGVRNARAKATPRGELLATLDAEHADAVLAHRRRIRKPLTDRAAKLLAQKFGQCPDPNAAADAMIANGWQGFEPEWLANRGAPPNRSPPEAEPNPDLVVLPPDHPDFQAVQRLRGSPVVVGNHGTATFRRSEIEQARRAMQEQAA